MKIFITGATGFIGGHVAQKLIARGDEVIALARRPDKSPAMQLEADGATIMRGDVTERESMRPGMQGADLVIHCAGWYDIGVRDSSSGYAINVDGTRNTLSLAYEMDIEHIVYVSTCGIFGNTNGLEIEPIVPDRDSILSEYDRTKYLAHKVAIEIIAAGAPVSICCPAFVYGPDDPSPLGNTIRQLLKRELPMMPARGSGASYVHVEDVADGINAAGDIGKPGEIYILSGDSWLYDRLVPFIGEVSGVKMPFLASATFVPLIKALMSAIVLVLPVPSVYHPETFAYINPATFWVSHESTKAAIGYNPRPAQEGLRETILHEMSKLAIPAP